MSKAALVEQRRWSVTVQDVPATRKEAKAAKAALSMGDVLRRKGPRSDVKALPRNPDLLRIQVGSVVGMTEQEIASFAWMMNEYGAAVLTPRQDPDDGLAAYTTLDRLLGKCVSHDQMNEQGIVEINPVKATSINTANPKKAHLPHTDDAYTEQPSRFITLQCRKAAPSGGGEHVLVSGVEPLAALSSEELRTLMRPGMVQMGRRPAGDGSWMKCSSIPMFWVNRESGWLQLRWRCNDGCVADVDDSAKSAYERLDGVAKGDVHQCVLSLKPSEILIVDNRAVAHGRREYESDEPRIMWRRNYVGDGELESKLSVGMCATYTSLFEPCSSLFEPRASLYEADYDVDMSNN